MLQIEDLDFELRPALVPDEPLRDRGSSRLMVLDRAARTITHARFQDLPELLSGETVYLNDSRIRGTDPAYQDRRQPVYARKLGGLGAPTAGLDFTDELLAKLSPGPRFLTLHVGTRSFGKLQETPDGLRPAELAPEDYEILVPPADGEHVVAVGTTVVKALETWARGGIAIGRTDLFIEPGHEFLATKALVTNLHTPRDPHLLLAGAFAGLDFLLEAYEVAKAEGYLFSGYGDAMLIR